VLSPTTVILAYFLSFGALPDYEVGVKGHQADRVKTKGRMKLS
jgi:hypothetical protein